MHSKAQVNTMNRGTYIRSVSYSKWQHLHRKSELCYKIRITLHANKIMFICGKKIDSFGHRSKKNLLPIYYFTQVCYSCFNSSHAPHCDKYYSWKFFFLVICEFPTSPYSFSFWNSCSFVTIWVICRWSQVLNY